ncbi:Intraflagellar transport protein 57 [Araneus ventricosus]|uniref:Intraflagellar transport protein 57 n=1 Tax=Araneus ventricosus TaxID=182803 RepID=A0A4Y2HJU4_ARAVE|nr:Intraflagellar transport protein 57 [Araneus ventricosus]
MADNRLFLCSSVSSALLYWPRCAITANRLFLCSSVSSALLSCPRCAMSDSRLFLCSSVSPALLSWPRCAIVGQSAASFFFSFNNSPFTFSNCLPSTGSTPCNSSFSFRHRKKRELNKAKIEAFEDEDSEDEGEILDLEALRNLSIAKQDKGEKNKPDEVMESNVDAMEWKLEVERVMHQLKVTVRNDSRDWRSHLDQIRQHRKNIDETMSTTKTQLDKLYTDISRSLEKIGSREKYLNNQLEQLVLEYRTAQDQLSQVREQYKSVSGGVTERSRILSQITEELDQVKQEMEERGSNMTDGSKYMA